VGQTGGNSTGLGGTATTGGKSGSGGQVATGGAKSSGGQAATGGATNGGSGGSGGVATGGSGGSVGGTSLGGAGATGKGGSNGKGGSGGASGGAAGAGGGAAGSSAVLLPGNEPVKSSGCGKAPALTSGAKTIMVGGRNRDYTIRIPDNYDNNKPYRLIFGMHYIGANAAAVDVGSNILYPYYGIKGLDTEKSANRYHAHLYDRL
jgi:hypothetical protein